MELKPFGISAVEQPLPHAQVKALANVRQKVGVPIMHDESLCGMIDAERAVADATCDLFNVRLSRGIDAWFDVTKDGRFLIPVQVEQTFNASITVVVNWQAELKK